MASASNVSVNQPLTLVLMGRTGNGKSSTGNSILGRKAFRSTKSFESVTKESKMEQCTCEDGRVLNVIDTPDLFDKNASKEFLRKEVFKCFELAKDGFHGVLYVLSIKSRFTEQEADVLDSLLLELGPKILNYMVVVFTGGDILESDGLTLQGYLNNIPQKLKDVLHKCKMRTELFDNKTTMEENQRSELLQKIDCIIADNGGVPYSNGLFNEAQANPYKRGADLVEEYSIEKREKGKPEQFKRLSDEVNLYKRGADSVEKYSMEKQEKGKAEQFKRLSDEVNLYKRGADSVEEYSIEKREKGKAEQFKQLSDEKLSSDVKEMKRKMATLEEKLETLDKNVMTLSKFDVKFSHDAAARNHLLQQGNKGMTSVWRTLQTYVASLNTNGPKSL